MAYHLYQTEGVILNSFNIGEGNELFIIYTKEMGLISAFAKSSRESVSKLSPALQKFSWINLSLVKGKGGIRITGASEILNAYFLFRESPEKKNIILRTYSLLSRLLYGEEKDRELYIIIRGQIDFLNRKELNKKQTKIFEALVISKILRRLGYLSCVSGSENLIEKNNFEDSDIEKFSDFSRETVKMINKSLKDI